MNIEAKPGSELATRSSYENFVIELAEKMGVDEKVYLPKEEGEFDYEDIYSWIRAVDFRNGTPKIERTIKEDGGTKTVKLNTQELDVIKDEDEKLSKEAQLYVMAVTEAKMAVVAELAEDTYPAVRYQMNDVRREMQKVRQEIFGVEDKKKSIKEVLDKMVSRKKIQAATALIIASMILAACTNPTQVSATEVIYPTQPVATEVSPTPIYATSTAMETPEATAMPEQAENEIVIEGLTGVKPDFLLDGKLEIKEELGRKFYGDFLDALAKNEQNQKYMAALLGENPDGAKLLDYLQKNDYVLPAGLNLPYRHDPGYVKLGNNPIKEEIKLDTIKGVAFGPNEWNGNTAGITDYVNSLKTYGSLWVNDGMYTCQYIGWAIDSRDNRLVFVAGAKTAAPIDKYPWTEVMAIGGGDGNFDFDRDSKIVIGEWLQIIKLLKVYENGGTAWQVAVPFLSLCGEQETSAVCDIDVANFLGDSEKNMFELGRQN